MKLCITCNVGLKDHRSIRCKSCSKKGKLNPVFGKKFVRSIKFKDKMKLIQTGENNSNWKGDEVGYLGVHSWVNRHKSKTKFCEECGIKPSYDLANISQKYKRDLNDWEYLCRKCHMLKDGRLPKIKTK